MVETGAWLRRCWALTLDCSFGVRTRFRSVPTSHMCRHSSPACPIYISSPSSPPVFLWDTAARVLPPRCSASEHILPAWALGLRQGMVGSPFNVVLACLVGRYTLPFISYVHHHPRSIPCSCTLPINPRAWDPRAGARCHMGVLDRYVPTYACARDFTVHAWDACALSLR